MALADIAETALAALLPAVTAEFARAHDEVPGGAFTVVAMGRLGSREMSLASDLDLVLIYDAPEDSPGSTGPRPLPASTYYGRLGQRLISAITAPTGEGKLYEVDMRLRPSGESGPIASSLAAFAQYQRESAWSWAIESCSCWYWVAAVSAAACRHLYCNTKHCAAPAASIVILLHSRTSAAFLAADLKQARADAPRRGICATGGAA